MRVPESAALLVLLLAAACATTSEVRRPEAAGEPLLAASAPPPVAPPEPGSAAPSPDPAPDDRSPASPAPAAADDALGARLVARGLTAMGRRTGFTLGSERFPGDCSGYVSWIYEAEGLPLRQLLMRAAPGERSGVAALYAVTTMFGVVFGGGGEWPRPGDLVFFRDTYDRNRNGRWDDPFTHVGLVEQVDENGTVTFLHRGSHGVARGYLTVERPTERREEDGRELNSILRRGRRRADVSAALAGRLFMGYGRIDLSRVPAEGVAFLIR